MSKLQAFQMAGGAIGPAIGGFLVGFGAGVPFVACGLFLGLLALAATVLALPEWRRNRTAAAEAALPGSTVWTRGLVAVSVVGFTVFFVRFGGQQFMFPVLAYDRAGLSPTALGLAISASTVINLLLIVPSGELTDRWGRRRMVIAATTGVAITTLLFLASDSATIFVLALVVTGIAMAFTGPSTGAFLAESVPAHKRGTAVGIYRTFGDVAIMVGPLLLGWLIEHGHTDLAICLLSAITALVVVTFVLLTRENRPRPAGSATRRRRDVNEIQSVRGHD